jgi:chromosome segregation ATPase
LEGTLEKSRRAEARAAAAEQRASELEGHGSTLARALEDERVKRDEARSAAVDLKERLDSANAAAAEAAQRSDARIAELESLATAGASDDAQAQVEAVKASIQARVSELEGRVAEATKQAKDAERELARSAEAATSETERRAELERKIAELERDHDTDPDSELERLRGELGAAIERAHQAEERARILQADLLAAHRGVDPEELRSDPDEEPDDAESLRSRLARTAARKKGTMEGKG